MDRANVGWHGTGRSRGHETPKATVAEFAVASSVKGSAVRVDRCPEQRRADPVSSLPLHGRGDVAVEIGEQRRIGMAESFRRHLRWDTARQHECGTGVTQSVGGQPWKAEFLGIDAETP